MITLGGYKDLALGHFRQPVTWLVRLTRTDTHPVFLYVITLKEGSQQALFPRASPALDKVPTCSHCVSMFTLALTLCTPVRSR